MTLTREGSLIPQKVEIAGREIPEPVLIVLRGVGQVFFQENALTGLLFVIGIAVSSPLMAIGAIIGSTVGTFTAKASNSTTPKSRQEFTGSMVASSASRCCFSSKPAS